MRNKKIQQNLFDIIAIIFMFVALPNEKPIHIKYNGNKCLFILFVVIFIITFFFNF